jgi:hypothetical protein
VRQQKPRIWSDAIVREADVIHTVRLACQVLQMVGGAATSQAQRMALRHLPMHVDGCVDGAWDPQPHLTRHHVDLLLCVLHLLPPPIPAAAPATGEV